MAYFSIKNLFIISFCLICFTNQYQFINKNNLEYPKIKHTIEKTENDEILGVKKITGNVIKKYLLKKDTYVIDTRDIPVCATGYIPNSIVLPLSLYSSWFPPLVQQYTKIIIVSDAEKVKESINKTRELGEFEIIGYSFYDEVYEEISFNFKEIEYNKNTKSDIEELVNNNKYILDIREISEFKETGVIKEAHLIPLSTFKTGYINLPKDENIYVYCRSGMRAVVGMTFAQRGGYTNKFIIMEGGMNKAISEGYPVVPYEE